MSRLLILFVFLLSGNGAMAYEQPRYEVLQRYEGFELRRYEPYLVAETVVTGAFDEVGNAAFRLLAGYIGGNNRGREKIAMTAPVEQTPGEKIAMTVPVSQTPQTGQPDSYVLSFMMPSGYSLDSLPQPTDPRVTLRRVEARLMAARSYSGTWSQARYREQEAALLQAVQAAGLRPLGAPVFARYNPPFTPWFMRRNEVLVPIEAAPAAQPGGR